MRCLIKSGLKHESVWLLFYMIFETSNMNENFQIKYILRGNQIPVFRLFGLAQHYSPHIIFVDDVIIIEKKLQN